MAIMDEYIDSNPAEKLLPVSHQKPAIDPFSSQEKEAILQELQGDAYLYYLLAFETGMRTAELMALRWSDIRESKAYLNRTLVLRTIKDMKIKQCRTVALSARVQQALKAAPRAITGDLWLNSKGEPRLDGRYFVNAWHTALTATGVRYRRPYNCRHTRASLGLSAGQTPAWLAKQMGHDLRTFFERYADFVDSDSDALEMAKLENHDSGINVGQTSPKKS
jgi:integrase